MVFLANPNNPTGRFLPAGELARLPAGLPGNVLLVIDQAYAEYLAPDDDDGGLALAAAHDNVLVTRTFSKTYGLAGDRIGWGHRRAGAGRRAQPHPRAVQRHHRAGRRPWWPRSPDQAFVDTSREHNRAERARFVAAIEALGNHGLRAVPSEANFVLVLFEGP